MTETDRQGSDSLGRPRLVVVCKDEPTLVSLDRETLTVVQRVRLSGIGHEVAVDPVRRVAFVPLFGTGGVGGSGRSGDGLDVVDLDRGTVRTTIALPPGSRPHDVVLGPAGLLHVTAEGLSAVLSIDRRTGRVVSSRPTGHSQAHMLAVTRDGSHAYTANVRPGSLSAITLTERRPVRTLPLAPHLNRLSLSPDGREAYVADQDRPRLAVVDVIGMTVRTWLDLPDIAFGTAPTPDGRFLVLALRRAGRIGILELASGTLVGSARVPPGPQRVVLDQDGQTAYTACSPANVVAAIDLRSLTVVGESHIDRDPDGLALLS